MAFERIVRVNYASAPSCLTGVNVARDYDRYHLPSARLHHRALHGAGVAAGLELAVATGRPNVTVGPGVAIDPQGRMVVLADDGLVLVGESKAVATVPAIVPTPAAGAAGTLVLTVQYAEDPAVPVDPANPAGCKQVELRPWLRLQDPHAPLDANTVVVLGAVSLDAGGLVIGSSAEPRQLLGTVTGSLRIERATDSPDGTGRSPAGALLPAGAGLRLEAQAGPLTVEALSVALSAAGGVAVTGGGDLTLDQGAAGTVSVGQLARDLADARARIVKLEAVLGALVGPDGDLRPAGTIHIPEALQRRTYAVPLWLNAPDNEFFLGSQARWRYTGSMLQASPNKETVSNLHVQLPRGAVIRGFSFSMSVDNDEDSEPVPALDYPLVVELQECNLAEGKPVARTFHIIGPVQRIFGDGIFGGSSGSPVGAVGFATSDGLAYRVRLAAGIAPISPKFSLYFRSLNIHYSVATVY